MTTGVQTLSAEGLRRRRPSLSAVQKQPDVEEIKAKSGHSPTVSRQSSLIGLIIILACLAFTAFLCAVCVFYPRIRLEAASKRPPSPERPFDLERAMKHISIIAAKPRWVSTAALEEAFEYIQHHIAGLQGEAERNGLKLEVELFRSDHGSFLTGIANIDLINTYSNISSVVARLSPQDVPDGGTRDSLLINAHVDSAAGAPGASDNVCGVAVAMELLRCVVLNKHHDLKRPIVFLFNGAEEVVLNGAHSFVTQHQWAPTIAAHINLESVGSGDTYTLMNQGPYNMWLAESYVRSVSMPASSVVASDIMHAKVFPGETDFRVFSEYGDIPGFDFVLSDNGYIYHTTSDNVENVDPLGVYHGGITMLELTMDLVGPRDAIGSREAEQASDPLTKRLIVSLRGIAHSLRLVPEPPHLRAVYFDILNIVPIAYDEGVAAILNVAILFLTVVIWTAKTRKMDSFSIGRRIRMFATLMACFVAALASASFAAVVYSEVFQSKLRWYGSLAKALAIFGPPAVFGGVSALFMFLPRRLTASRFEEMLFAVAVYNSLLSIILMKVGFMSCYIPIWVLVSLNVCALQGEVVHPVVRYMQYSFVYVILWAKLSAQSLFALLPLFGRAKSEAVPHDMIAALITTYYVFSFIVIPLLPILCHYAHALRAFRNVTFLSCMFVGIAFLVDVPNLTLVGKNVVYSFNAPKRVFGVHFSSRNQTPNTVISLFSLDPVEMEADRIVSSIPSALMKGDLRRDLPFWGALNSTCAEAVRPFSMFVQDTVAVEFDEAPQLPSPRVFVEKEDELDNGWNVTYTIEALESHQITYRFLAGSSSLVMDWSINAPRPDDPDGPWIRHTGSSTYSFWVLLRKADGQEERPKLRMVLTNARFGSSRSPNGLAKLSFEDWEAPVFMVSVGVEVEV